MNVAVQRLGEVTEAHSLAWRRGAEALAGVPLAHAPWSDTQARRRP